MQRQAAILDGLTPQQCAAATQMGVVSEERQLAYVAIAWGTRRVTILHCAFRPGHAAPSSFLDDIPDRNRITGRLRGPARKPGRVPTILDDRLDAAELLRRF